jgi:hypothetical protein
MIAPGADGCNAVLERRSVARTLPCRLVFNESALEAQPVTATQRDRSAPGVTGSEKHREEEDLRDAFSNGFGRSHSLPKQHHSDAHRQRRKKGDARDLACWGNPNMQRVMEDSSYASSIELYLERCKATSGRWR